jgi:hypothetical protein
MIGQRCHDGLRAFLGHHIVETMELLIMHAAAALEAFHNLRLDAAQHRQPLRARSKIGRHRAAGQASRMLGG